MSKAKRKTKGKKFLIAAAVITAIAAISALIPQSAWDSVFVKAGLKEPKYKSAPMSVHFVDVGQGDCTVITAGSGETVIIDSGEEIKSGAVINYLKSLSVSKIDYCIVTHPHSDHYGGMLEILKEFPAENTIMPALNDENTPKDSYYRDFVAYVKSSCKRVAFIKDSCKITVGDVNLKIIAPVTQRAELNDMSLIVKASHGGASFLITGDCSADEEKDILKNYPPDELKCTVLKAGHHGSDTALSEEWLNAAAPEMCVITAGRYNSYSLPAEETLEKLEARSIKYYRTDICGTVVFDCNKDEISISYSRDAAA